MQTKQQANNEQFEFWKRMFAPRSDKWKRSNLRRLNDKKSVFETDEERINKINALEYLLGY